MWGQLYHKTLGNCCCHGGGPCGSCYSCTTTCNKPQHYGGALLIKSAASTTLLIDVVFGANTAFGSVNIYCTAPGATLYMLSTSAKHLRSDVPAEVSGVAHPNPCPPFVKGETFNVLRVDFTDMAGTGTVWDVGACNMRSEYQVTGKHFVPRSYSGETPKYHQGLGCSHNRQTTRLFLPPATPLRGKIVL